MPKILNQKLKLPLIIIQLLLLLPLQEQIFHSVCQINKQNILLRYLKTNQWQNLLLKFKKITIDWKIIFQILWKLSRKNKLLKIITANK